MSDTTLERIDVEEIRDRVNLVDLVGSDVKLTECQSGGKHYYYGACPWCEGNDRFKVFVNDGGLYFNCRQCERSGDVIAYVMERRGLSFVEASQWLESATVAESQRKPAQNALERPLSGDSLDIWRNWLNVFADQALAHLLTADTDKTRGALVYLADRGITPTEVAHFGIGYTPKWRDIMPGYKLPPGIIIPRWRPESILISAVNVYLDKSARELTGHRRMFVKGSNPKRAMFNQWRIADDIKTVIIVEGELDACLLGRFLPPVANDYIPVATGGAGMHPDSLDQLQNKRVIVIPDNDQAGRKAAAKWRESLPDVVLARIPKKHKDLTEFWASDGNLDRWVKGVLAEGQEGKGKEITF